MLRLKELREKKGLTQAGVAAKLGLSRQAYNFYENGKRDPDTQMLRTLAAFYGVSADYLLGGEFSPSSQFSNFVTLSPENKKIPIIGAVKCGTNGLAYQYLEGYVLVGEEYKGDIVAFRCRGDSMKNIGITEGDLAIVRQQEDVESGDLAIIVIDGEEGTLKRVRKFDSGISLEAANDDYPPRFFIGEDLNLLHIVGKVIEVRKRF